MENNTKKCPKCMTEIDKKASVCPNCKTDLRNWFVRHWIISILLLMFVYYIGNMSYLYNEWTKTLITVNWELEAPVDWKAYYNNN